MASARLPRCFYVGSSFPEPCRLCHHSCNISLSPQWRWLSLQTLYTALFYWNIIQATYVTWRFVVATSFYKGKKKQVKLILIIYFNSIYPKYYPFQHILQINNYNEIFYIFSFILSLLNLSCSLHLQNVTLQTLNFPWTYLIYVFRFRKIYSWKVDMPKLLQTYSKIAQ